VCGIGRRSAASVAEFQGWEEEGRAFLPEAVTCEPENMERPFRQLGSDDSSLKTAFTNSHFVAEIVAQSAGGKNTQTCVVNQDLQRPKP